MIISDSLDERWASLWVFDAFWHVLYLAILVSIACIWSPSQNSLQLAYSDELLQEDEPEPEEEADDEAKDACVASRAARRLARASRPVARRPALQTLTLLPPCARRRNLPLGASPRAGLQARSRSTTMRMVAGASANDRRSQGVDSAAWLRHCVARAAALRSAGPPL